MTLAEFARLTAVCVKCSKRGGHRLVFDLIECECGEVWRAAVPMILSDALPEPAPETLTDILHELFPHVGAHEGAA